MRDLNRVSSNPARSRVTGNVLLWPLSIGSVNELKIRRWQWSRLGLGSVGIIVLLLVSFLLQSVRLRLGFGYPELPR